jgi:hypothetical protein
VTPSRRTRVPGDCADLSSEQATEPALSPVRGDALSLVAEADLADPRRWSRYRLPSDLACPARVGTACDPVRSRSFSSPRHSRARTGRRCSRSLRGGSEEALAPHREAGPARDRASGRTDDARRHRDRAARPRAPAEGAVGAGVADAASWRRRDALRQAGRLAAASSHDTSRSGGASPRPPSRKPRTGSGLEPLP